MVVGFCVLGEPVGKGRPKFRRVGEFTQTYTPSKTARYEQLVRLEYHAQVGTICFPKDSALGMTIKIIRSIPRNTSSKKTKMMLERMILPGKRPDVDNCVKVILDALNKIAFHDDSQVVRILAYSEYGEQPCVEVEIAELGING